MGGVIGAMSTKFVLHAGLLLMTARLEMHRVEAQLDPSRPRTAIAADLAERIAVADGTEDDQEVRRRRVIGVDRMELALPRVRVDRHLAPESIAIGSDLLNNVQLRLDFARGRLRVFGTRGEYRSATARMTAAPATVATDGCLRLTAADEAGRQVPIALIAGEQGVGTDGSVHDVVLAGLRVHAISNTGTTSRCPAEAAAIGWSAFAGRTIVLAPGDGKLFVSNARGG